MRFLPPLPSFCANVPPRYAPAYIPTWSRWYLHGFDSAFIGKEAPNWFPLAKKIAEKFRENWQRECDLCLLSCSEVGFVQTYDSCYWTALGKLIIIFSWSRRLSQKNFGYSCCALLHAWFPTSGEFSSESTGGSQICLLGTGLEYPRSVVVFNRYSKKFPQSSWPSGSEFIALALHKKRMTTVRSCEVEDLCE